MPILGPCYLIHGDDHGAVAERRASLVALARDEGDAANIELLEGEAGAPGKVADALRVMTFAIGRRVIIVDGVERWKEAEVTEHLAPAMSDMPPDTTLALFAREEAKVKAPASVHSAVKRAGGQIARHATVKPWELPAWAREQATALGLELDAAAAKTLVTHVGERQQRLVRELEKLAIEHGAMRDRQPLRLSDEQVRERVARSSEERVYALVDALIASDVERAVRSYLSLREQGERIAGCIYIIARGLRDALAVATRLAAGESAGEVKRTLRMSPRAAERYITEVSRSSPERLRAGLATVAELELNTRGGAILSRLRSPMSAMSEDTLVLQAIERIVA